MEASSETSTFNRALAMATRAHAGQYRKGTSIPYITHPVAVAALVAEYGGDAGQQAAALLHDVLEDSGAQWATGIRREFGDRVLAIVEACTDGTPGPFGAKAPWRKRKEAYLAALPGKAAEAQLVSACDKLANLRSIRADLDTVGLAVFERFKAGREGTLWYYAELCRIFRDSGSPASPALDREYRAILDQVALLRGSGKTDGTGSSAATATPAAWTKAPSADLERQLAFLAELEKLKLVERCNLVLGRGRAENSAEHSWNAALMALVLGGYAQPPGLNLDRAVRMLLIHDVVEIDAGDHFLPGDAGGSAEAAVKSAEARGAARLFGLLPDSQAREFLALWEEFEARSTPEARYAAAIDALQPVHNHLLCAQDGENPDGIKASWIRDRKAHIGQAAPALGRLAEELIAASVARGLYRPD